MAEMMSKQQFDYLVNEVLDALLDQLSKSITEELLQRWYMEQPALYQGRISEKQNQTTARLDQKLITENDAAKFYKANPATATVVVSKESIVTPLAVDFFRNRQIKLQYQ